MDTHAHENESIVVVRESIEAITVILSRSEKLHLQMSSPQMVASSKEKPPLLDTDSVVSTNI